MRVSVHAVGRMKAGPERELAGRYLDRFAKTGPAVGLEFSGVTEIAESRARSAAERCREEASALEGFRRDAALFLLDERGRNPSSPEISRLIADLRDGGRRQLVFAIGGPDGHDSGLRSSADFILSFGAQTWPHQLVRVLLAEQLYRAATILSGHPYHRV
ncbi:23S rRNA (pseudouridine(1915)-N(3))-methyltransferase RlmH [Aquamicrobium sp. LC103]|uniref:23S rRNA (pseudouridine(1915)-N(3))-methyltransferase RlmH n=1 Tax=Aquamicrobium sp. LC103 TaxID=1120658 RepID=UPI0009E32837|nr:23S rRNA (pseudouridine(1915)-N(3))-methyltransferase RlmH [Aquamicrobium sp. LC103]TKT82992.1 23S rRNA (pseudouridine(1915)-N(3))-methyltransferase RlmH [Aquamicrobium sp. LC103]